MTKFHSGFLVKQYLLSHFCRFRFSPFYPFFVLGYVFGVEEFTGRRVLAENVIFGRARVHEDLSDHRQARIDNVRLVHVEHEVRILDHIHPEPER